MLLPEQRRGHRRESPISIGSGSSTNPAWDFGIGAYDLLENPQSVCLTILGTPDFGVGYGVSTNEVVVPKESIATALKSGLP